MRAVRSDSYLQGLTFAGHAKISIGSSRMCPHHCGPRPASL